MYIKDKRDIYPIETMFFHDRILFLENEIEDNTISDITKSLMYLDSQNNKDIKIYINSPGGAVTSGLYLYDVMNGIKSDIQTICCGQCASMASLLLSSGTKGKRYALPNSRIMIHQPLGGVTGQASDISIQTKEIMRIKEKMNIILAKNTGQSIDVIKNDTDRDNFMTVDEAIAYGLIDGIIGDNNG